MTDKRIKDIQRGITWDTSIGCKFQVNSSWMTSCKNPKGWLMTKAIDCSSGHCPESQIHIPVLILQHQETRCPISHFLSPKHFPLSLRGLLRTGGKYVTWLVLLERVNSLHTSRLRLRHGIEGTRICPAQQELFDSRTSSQTCFYKTRITVSRQGEMQAWHFPMCEMGEIYGTPHTRWKCDKLLVEAA